MKPPGDDSKLTAADIQAIIDAAYRHAEVLNAVEKAYDGGNVIETFELLRQLFRKKKGKPQ